MFRYASFESNGFSKDARSTAPSTFCAHNAADTFNNVIFTGIAAAVSVFILFAIISIISYGIIIRDIIMITMFVIIMSEIIMMHSGNKFNIKAKLLRQ